jgi:hypothetical protein
MSMLTLAHSQCRRDVRNRTKSIAQGSADRTTKVASLGLCWKASDMVVSGSRMTMERLPRRRVGSRGELAEL